jgi:shikimate dehydrogenase
MRHYVMIGAPVTSVRTPPLLAARLKAMGVPAEVAVRHVEPEELASFMAEIRDGSRIDGLLVTMPHKSAIVPHLDGLAGLAARLGGVNTVKRVDGIAIAGRRVGLVGTGDAGTAIACALAAERPARLDLADLDPARTMRAAGLAGENLQGVEIRTMERLDRPCDILVNATALGMRDGDPSPITPEIVGAASAVADIVADPPRTQLAALVRAAGIPLVTGREMVEAQVGPIADWLAGAAAEP